MIRWAQVTGFDRDQGNARKNAEKHHVSQAEAEAVFFNTPFIVRDDMTHNRTEARHHALGETDGARLLHITFTLRHGDTLIRVISARDMHRKEKAIYEQAKTNS